MRLKIFICFLLASITLAIYWPARHFHEIDLDDPVFLNIDTPSELNWHGLERVMTDVVAANWHPVTNLSFLIMRVCFGLNPGAEHLLNAILHAANTALLFLVLLRLTGATWRSAVVAALFAWHPLRVESVTWISERKDVLYVFFMLLSLLCYASYSQTSGSPTEKVKGRLRTLNYFLALLFFIFSLMSKGTVVTLPFLLLLLDFWPLQRLNRSTVRNLIIEKTPFFLLTICFCAVTFWVHKTHADVTSMEQFGPGERIENSILSYIKYLGMFFWPTNLAVPYPYPKSFDEIEVTYSVLLLLAISALCVLQLSRRPYLAVGWFWYLGTLVPVIGFIQVGEQALADRHSYVPLIGPAISLIWLVSEWVGVKWVRKSIAASIAASIMAIILVACIIATRIQMSYWRNAISLFERTVAVTPTNFVGQSSLAGALKHDGFLRRAATQFRIIISFAPNNYQPHYQLAECLNAMGYRDAAKAEYNATLLAGCDPNDYIGNMNMADSMVKLGRPAEAAPYLESVVRLNPDSLKELNNLAWLLATSPDPTVRNGPKAVELAEHACQLTHYQATPFMGTLAAAYAEAGRFDDAVAMAKKAIADAQKNGETELVQRNQELLKLYNTHKAYHEQQK